MKRILILLVTTFSLLGFSQDIKLNGTVSVENNQIKNVLEPTDGGDVVTKDYLISENNKLKQEIDSLKLKLNDLGSKAGCVNCEVAEYSSFAYLYLYAKQSNLSSK